MIMSHLDVVVVLLNKILEMDREGVSRHFSHSNLVNIQIADTSIELLYYNNDVYAQLTTLGLLNGALRCIDPTQRIDTVMRDPLIIEHFVVAPVPELEAKPEIPRINIECNN